MAFNLSRNTKFVVSTVDTGWTSSNSFEIPVLDGYSFTQDTETQTITVSEAGATPARGQRMYNTALAPAEFSFSTYVRPRFDATASPDETRAVEQILWDALASAALDGATTVSSASLDVDFAASAVNQLLKLNMYFYTGDTTYALTNAVLNVAEVDFSIDGIAMVTWSGFADAVQERIAGTTAPDFAGSPKDYLEVDTASDFIVNKLSTVTLTNDADATAYTVVLTGGSFTIDNGITFLTPEELGVLNTPLDHFTGTRSITGTITAYLKTGGTDDTGDLFNDLSTDTATTLHDFTCNLFVGGAGNKPRMELNMAQAHVTIPTINVEDVLSVEITFTALGSADFASTDEVTVKYIHTNSV